MSELLTKTPWPDAPYKGIAYYNVGDSLLFAGRESDIDDCSQLLAEPRTRLLILHGRTGCGKSSFLRAGLTPALEERGFAFQFLRRLDGKDKGNPVFIRCGHDPVSRIAEELFTYASGVKQVPSAIGNTDVDFSPALLGQTTLIGFVAACREPGVLWKAFAALSEKLWHTLVLIVDQAEEVITLTSPADEGRRNFARFLQEFANSHLKIKLILTVRKESFVDLFNLAQLDYSVRTDIKQFGLRDLNIDEVLRAIELPTDREPHDVGETAPFEHYGFSYAPGVAKKIASDLFAASPSGGVLPIMQIVCRDLFEDVRKRPKPWVVDEDLYRSGGQITGRIDRYITRSLQDAFQHARLAAPFEDLERRWRRVLCAFIYREADGTAKSDVLSAWRLAEVAAEQGVDVSASEPIDYLIRPDVLILRSFSALSSQGTGELFYSLGHDVIALVMNEWRVRESEAERIQKQIQEHQKQIQEQIEIRRKIRQRRLRRLGLAGVAVAAITAVGMQVYEWSLTLADATKQIVALDRVVERYKGTDKTLALTAAIEAAFRNRDTTPWWQRADPEPNRVLAALVSQLPAEVSRAHVAGEEVRAVQALPDSERLIFFDGRSQVYLFDTVTRSETVFDVSGQLLTGTAMTLEQVSESSGSLILLFTEVLPHRVRGASRAQPETLVLVIRDGAVAGPFTPTSLSAQIPSGALDPSSSAGAVLSRDRIYFYQYSDKDRRIEIKVISFVLNGASEPVGFKVGDAIQTFGSEFYAYGPRFLAFPREIDPSVEVKIVSWGGTKPWKIESYLQEQCRQIVASQKLLTGEKCDVRVVSGSWDDGDLLPVMLSTSNTSRTLRVFDIATGEEVKVDLASLEKRAGKEFLTGGSDYVVVGGSLEKAILGFVSRRGGVDIFTRAQSGWSYLGPLVDSELSTKFVVSRSGSQFLDGERGKYWNLSSYVASAGARSPADLQSLMVKICTGFPPDQVSEDHWRSMTGLGEEPPKDRCPPGTRPSTER